MKTYRTNLVLLTISITLLTILLFSCSSTQDAIRPSVLPPTGFSETDLIGKWQEDGIADSSETITLSADHKFLQTFDFLETNYHVELEGSWKLKKSKNGCAYIYLYGMKYFYQDQELVDNGNRWASGIRKGEAEKYWDECSESVIEMPDMVVLFVSQHPSYPKNIILRHLAIQRDVIDIIFSLSNITE